MTTSKKIALNNLFNLEEEYHGVRSAIKATYDGKEQEAQLIEAEQKYLDARANEFKKCRINEKFEFAVDMVILGITVIGAICAARKKR